MSSARTAFVTGGTGFLGLNVVDTLLAQGWRVVALHRATSNVKRLAARGVTLVEGSIVDRRSLDRAIPEGCDAVFHVAGNISLWSGDRAQQERENVDGTRHVMEASLARKAKRVVHTSSVSAWGAQERIPFDESAPQHGARSPINYERTKLLGELEVRAAIERGLSAVIMNPCHIVGRFDERGWSQMIGLVDRGKLPGIPPGGGSFCDAGAVAKAHVAAVDRGRPGDNYLLGGADATYVEMVRIIGELLGKKVPAKATPITLLALLGYAGQLASYVTRRAPLVTPEGVIALRHPLQVNCAKAVRELGYETVPLADMLRSAHAWMKEEGMLRA